jgi:hypothetical protein
MIVRISGEGQFRLSDADGERLNQLESVVVAIVDEGREDDFRAAFDALLSFARENGAELADDELETSQVILPPSDTTFYEARHEFTGEGLIPD